MVYDSPKLVDDVDSIAACCLEQSTLPHDSRVVEIKNIQTTI